MILLSDTFLSLKTIKYLNNVFEVANKKYFNFICRTHYGKIECKYLKILSIWAAYASEVSALNIYFICMYISHKNLNFK